MKLFRNIITFIITFLFLSQGVEAASPSDFFKKKNENTENEELSVEEIFMQTNFSTENCLLWPIGKTFIHVGDKLGLTLRPDTLLPDKEISYKDKIFTYKGSRDELIFGYMPSVNLIFECDGIIYKYESRKKRQEMERSTYRPLIPDLVPVSEIELAKKLLIGKTLYIKTSLWYNANGKEINGFKMVPVVITDILPGTNVLPIQFVFKTTDENEGRVFGVLSPEGIAGEFITFDQLFTFEDPKNKYKDISEEMWDSITQSKVKKGMTQQECRLAIGKPADIRQYLTTMGLREEWFYKTGAYLLFEDGILKNFRQ